MKSQKRISRYWLTGCVAIITVILLFAGIKSVWLTEKLPLNQKSEEQIHSDNNSDSTLEQLPQTVEKLPPESPLNEERIAKTAKEIGEREIHIDKPNPGNFYFLNGQYVSSPYTIRRKGYSLYINGIETFRHPRKPINYQEVLLPVPKEITTKTTWDEVEKIHAGTKPWIVQYHNWFFSHYPPMQAVLKFEKALRKLPFVKKANWIPMAEMGKDKGVLHVVDKQGGIRYYFGSWWDPVKKDKAGFFNPDPGDPSLTRCRPFTAEQVRENLEDRMQSRKKSLENGSFQFIYSEPLFAVYIIDEKDSGPSGNFGFALKDKKKYATLIVHVVEILKSNASPKLKANEVYSLTTSGPIPLGSYRPKNWVERIRDTRWMSIKLFVHKFKGGPQLDERVAALKKKYKISDWKQPPEPQVPQVPEKLKNDPRLTPEGAIKKALQLLEAKKYQEYGNYSLTPPKYGKRTLDLFTKNDVHKRRIIAFKNILDKKKKPVLDDIDDIGYFDVDIPKERGEIKGDFFEKVRLRKVGHLWLIR